MPSRSSSSSLVPWLVFGLLGIAASLPGLAQADPICQVEPATLPFGTVTAGDSLDLAFTIRNLGDGELAGVVRSACSEFRLVGADSTYALLATEERTFTIRFAPPDSGDFVCAIETGSDLCADVVATGRGDLPAACQVAPSQLSFGVVTVGAARELTFEVENVGGGLLSGTVSVPCPEFTLVDADAGYSLLAGERRMFTVRFAPPLAGAYQCTIDLGSPQCGLLPANGSGQLPPACAVDPASLPFGVVTTGEFADLFFTLENVGGGVLNGAVLVACPGFALLDADPSYRLAARETKDFTVRFAPPLAGAYECTIDLGSPECGTLPASGSGELPPACAVDPTSLLFGVVTMGESADLFFTLENVGGGVLNGAVLVACPGFTLLDADPNYSLAAGETKDFTVRFAPPLAGHYQCVIDLGAPECGSLLATGSGELPPECAVDPTSLPFGVVTTGEFADLPFAIENVGGGLLSGAVAVSCAGFALLDADPTYQLAGGETKTFTVRFAPPDSGDFVCDIAPGSNCGAIAASGRGDLPPACAVSPESGLVFGDIVVGESAELAFVLRNVGGGLLTGTVSEPCGSFAVVGSADYSLGAGEEQSVLIRFAPDANGAQVCPLDLGSPACPDYSASGSGVLLPSCEVVPLDLVFGQVTVGRSEDRSFTIHNAGSGRVQGVFAPSCNEFFVVDATAYDLGPFQTQEFTARYQPAGEGTHDCVIFLGGQCDDITVHGTAIEDPICEITPVRLDFGTLELGESAVRTFEIVNAGGQVLTGTVTTPCSEFHLQGSANYNLTSGQSQVFTVRYAPSEGGTASCDIETGSALCADLPAEGTAVLPVECVLQPPSLEFGELGPGSSRDLPFRLRNSGGQVLSGAVSTGCADFTVIGTRTYVLGPGAEQLFTVRFEPSSDGEQACQLDLGNEFCPLLPLRGSSRPPTTACQVEPLAIDFQAVLVEEAVIETFTISNPGETMLGGTVSLDCAAFTLLDDGDYQIGPGEMASFAIEFRPPGEGEFECLVGTGSDLCDPVELRGTGALEVVCRVVPSFLDFGVVDVGTRSERTFRVVNMGQSVLEGVVTTRQSCPGFSLVGPTGYSLASGQEQEFLVRFEPLSVGPATCTIETGAPGCSDLSLRAVGRSPAVCEITPSRIDFGEVPIGTAVRVAIQISNRGDGLLEGDFSIDCPAVQLLGDPNFEVGPDQSVERWVEFLPEIEASYVCQIGAGTSCASILVLGFGIAEPVPDCDIVPHTLDFGTVVIGAEALRGLTVRNIGSGRLQGTLASTCPEVTILDSPLLDLAAGASRTLRIRFAPTAEGPIDCALTTTLCARTLVRGLGVLAPGSVCDLFPLRLEYGRTPIGEPAAANLVVSNHGGGRLTGTLRTDCSQFIIDGDPEIDLSGGDSRSVRIRFSPGDALAYDCRLWFQSDSDTCGPVELSGLGTSSSGAICRIDPSRLEFGDVDLGSAQRITFELGNDGTGVLAGRIVVQGSEYRLVGEDRFALASGQTRAVEIEFAPAREGVRTATIDLGTNGCFLVASGRGAVTEAPLCFVDPARLSFGSVSIGDFVERVLLLENRGGGRLGGVVGLFCPGFEIVEGGGEFSLARGESREVRIRYQPREVGRVSCVLDACADIPLVGAGVSGSVRVDLPGEELALLGFGVRPSEPTVGGIFGALGTPGRDYQLFHWSEADSGYRAAASDLDAIDPGRGYWVWAPGSSKVVIAGEPAADGPWIVNLERAPAGRAGWTLFGYPFQFDLPVSSVRVGDGFAARVGSKSGDPAFLPGDGLSNAAAGALVPLRSPQNRFTEPVIWSWNGTRYVSAQTLQPGHAYWIRQLAAEPAVLVIENDPFEPVPTVEGVPGFEFGDLEPEWSIGAEVLQGDQVSPRVEVGAAQVAAGAWNRLDLASVPAPPQPFLDAYLPHNDWGRLSGRYLTEFQPAAPTMVFDFVITGLQPGSPARIEFERLGVPTDFSIHVTNWDRRWRRVVPASGRLELDPVSSRVSIRVVVSAAPPETVPPESELPVVVVEGFVAVPNPFRSNTDLYLTLEQPGEVRIEIFDARGRRVRELSTRAESGGELTVTWDGLDAFEHEVQAGVYLVRVRVPGREVKLSLIRMK